jgi:hypothetical protein
MSNNWAYPTPTSGITCADSPLRHVPTDLELIGVRKELGAAG